MFSVLSHQYLYSRSVQTVMIGGWPEWVQTGRLDPLWTPVEGAVWAEPFGLPRIGPHAALRPQVNTQSIDLRPRPCLRPDAGQREHRYLWNRTLAYHHHLHRTSSLKSFFDNAAYVPSRSDSANAAL